MLENVSTNLNDKETKYKMDHYIFQSVSLVLLLIIISINYYYIKHQIKQKIHYHMNNIKIAKNSELN